MMTTAQQFLSAMLETVQHSQDSLFHAVSAASSHSLKSIFKTQLQEYDRIESEIQSIAARRGWELPELQPAVKWFSGFRFRLLLRLHSADSCIAERMISLHTVDMVNTLKLLHRYDPKDDQILTLFQKLLDCKTMNIRQMQPFL